MNRVIEILMKRDGLTLSEAEGFLADVREEISRAADSWDYYLIEDIMLNELGLKMDYLGDVVY